MYGGYVAPGGRIHRGVIRVSPRIRAAWNLSPKLNQSTSIQILERDAKQKRGEGKSASFASICQTVRSGPNLSLAALNIDSTVRAVSHALPPTYCFIEINFYLLDRRQREEARESLKRSRLRISFNLLEERSRSTIDGPGIVGNEASSVARESERAKERKDERRERG